MINLEFILMKILILMNFIAKGEVKETDIIYLKYLNLKNVSFNFFADNLQIF